MTARAATRLFRAGVFGGVLCGLLCTAMPAQTTAARSPHTAAAKTRQQKSHHRRTARAALRSECVSSVGLCVSVPASWQRLGDVFGQLGFVAAEPRPGNRSSWPQLTVAALPPAEGSDGNTRSLDSLMNQMLVPDGSSNSPRTLERRHLLLNGADAQLVRVQFPASGDDSSGAIEQLALIDGGNGFVYSIALRCAPQDFAHLDPVFQQAARSWRLEAPGGKQEAHAP